MDCLSPVCAVSWRPDGEVMTTSSNWLATVCPHLHLGDSPWGNTRHYKTWGCQVRRLYPPFVPPVQPMIKIGSCTGYVIVVRWVVELLGMEQFTFYVCYWHHQDILSSLWVFFIARSYRRSPVSPSPVCDSPLGSFCSLILSSGTLKLPVWTNLAICRHLLHNLPFFKL